jgi:DNA invertase Pin-like site-specific DNA recombinase
MTPTLRKQKKPKVITMPTPPEFNPSARVYRVAIYARHSPKPAGAVGDNYSIASQLHALREKALREYNCEDPVEFVDREKSGTNTDRPELDRLRDGLVDRLFDVVLAYSMDRWSRDTTDAVLLLDEVKKAGAQLDFCSGKVEDTPEGEAMYEMQGVFAKLEAKKFKERSRRCRRQKAREGFMTPGSVPFGFRYRGHRDGHRGCYEIMAGEAAVVKRILELVAAGNGNTPYRVALILNEEGIPTAKGFKWTAQTIRQLMRHTAYYGVAPGHAGIPIPCPKIVEKELWDAAHAQVRLNRPQFIGRPPREYLLTSFIWCATCGKRIVSMPHHGQGAYRCGYIDQVTHKRHCDASLVAKQALEAAVWKLLVDALTRSAVLWRLAQEYYSGVTGARQQKKNPVLVKLERARAKAANIQRVMLDSNRPIDYAVVKAAMEAAQRTIADLEGQLKQSAVLRMPERASIDAVTRQMADVGRLEDFDLRRKLLLETVTKIELSHDAREFTIHARVQPAAAASKWNRRIHADSISTPRQTAVPDIQFAIKGRVA